MLFVIFSFVFQQCKTSISGSYERLDELQEFFTKVGPFAVKSVLEKVEKEVNNDKVLSSTWNEVRDFIYSNITEYFANPTFIYVFTDKVVPFKRFIYSFIDRTLSLMLKHRINNDDLEVIKKELYSDCNRNIYLNNTVVEYGSQGNITNTNLEIFSGMNIFLCCLSILTVLFIIVVCCWRPKKKEGEDNIKFES